MLLRYWINRENVDKYGWEGLSANPNATTMLEKRVEYEKTLTKEEYDLLESKIDWCKLLANPGILLYLLNDFKLLKDKYLYSLLIDPNKSNEFLILCFKDEYLKGLSSNPNAIKILESNPDIIDYFRLSGNLNAIKLIKQRNIYENKLSFENYNKLENKIDWDVLCSNSNAIKILEANKYKIEQNGLDALSLNPNANKLILTIPSSQYYINKNLVKKICRSNDIEEIKKLKNPDWDELYSNPVAIDLIYKKVNKETLSIPEKQKIFENPNIFITDKEVKSKLKKWRSNPEINPYTDESIKVSIFSNREYVKLYKSFLEYLVSVNEPNIISKLPTTHCYTFSSTLVDLSFYKRNGKKVKLKTFDFDYLFTTYYLKDYNVSEFNLNYFLYKIISRQFEINSKLAKTYPDILDVLKDIMLDESLKVFIEMVNEYIYDLCVLILPLTKLANRIELEDPEYTSYFAQMLDIDTNVLPETIKNMKNRLHCILHLINLFGKKDIFERIKKIKIDYNYVDDDNVYIIYDNIISVNGKTFRNFLVSSIFDIEEIHIESKQAIFNNVKDPYDNLPVPPQIPRPPILSQELILYNHRKSTRDNFTVDREKEEQLKEFNELQKEYNNKLKEYDKKRKEYNKTYLGKKVSPHFSVSIDRNSSDYTYTPIKTSKRSLDLFKEQKSPSSSSTLKDESSDIVLTDELKSKFYEYIYDGTDIESYEDQEKLQMEYDLAVLKGKISKELYKKINKYSGGKESLSAIKKQLRLDKQRLDKLVKNKCDLSGNDPFTMESYADMHRKKIKYLSKIKTEINGNTLVNCYDTIPIYNYVLSCKKSGSIPINIAVGREPFTKEHLKEIFKKIKYFTKRKTLEIDDSINIRLGGTLLITIDETKYFLLLKIDIGTIDFPIFLNNEKFYILTGEKTDEDTPHENSYHKTIFTIYKGFSNGRLLEQSHYPYIPTRLIKKSANLFSLPKFPNTGTLEEKTKQFNDQLELLVA